MASLLERLSVPSASSSVGPIRSRSSNRSSPYSRPPKGDINATWSHDLYQQDGDANGGRSLSDRLSGTAHPPKANLNNIAQKALREAASAVSGPGLSIKGASSGALEGNVVQIEGLVQGTTAADVQAIFKSCGPIISAKVHNPPPEPGSVVIRVTYKSPADAQKAVKKFHGQTADGRMLSVKIIGAQGASLVGRLGAGESGIDIVKEAGSVDVLIDGSDSGSKLRSDSLVSDPRAQIMVAPPGTNPKEYVQSTRRGRGGAGGRGRGRRGRGGGRGPKESMDID